MRTTFALASLLSAAACASASRTASPVLAFTSQQSPALQFEAPADASFSTFVSSLFAVEPSSDAKSAGFLNSVFGARQKPAACDLGAIAIVRAEKLDGNTFASLRHSSTDSLRARSLEAPEQITFNAQPEVDPFQKINSAFAKTCKPSRMILSNLSLPHDFDFTRSQRDLPGNKHAPHLLELPIDDLRTQESDLLQFIEELDDAYPRNLVIILLRANTGTHQHSKRQVAASPSSSDDKWVEPTGGVFAKYQLFSTPLLLVLLLVGGVLVPIVFFAVAQLAQVQTPDQMGVRKDPISGDKKTQ
ncbi:hypothetical protein PANT_9c00070 [Moesziomyces antarcticus T-34]|uniref:Protein BIG1 n=1 Tax=Pseudozyma antarctica (strain T-34) TaxID=1151754 RepID=M9M0F6_PSEA3|nr:hypothetical protein PANT_9c00070 [Moesziomyces antarcticus T-34]